MTLVHKDKEIQAIVSGNSSADEKIKSSRRLTSVAREMRFTDVYRRYENAHPYVREIMCLREQVPATLMPIEAGDWFAGRLDRSAVGIDQERGGLTDAAYFCQFEVLTKELREPDTSAPLRRDIQFLLDFWKDRATYVKCRKGFSERLHAGLPSDDYYSCHEISYPMYGLGGPCIDYHKLLRLGINGLRAEVRRQMGLADKAGQSEQEFYNCLLDAMDIFSQAAVSYAGQTEQMAQSAGSPESARRFRLIAESLRHIADQPPRTYHQAVQLFWLYALVALPRNYGRMDVYLGDFLAADLDNKIITPDEALDMTVSLWRLIIARSDNFNNRVIIGGAGRPNPDHADRFAMLALEAQGIVRGTIPQVSLRWHEGMDPAILDQAMETLGKGSTFPIFYNDDVNIPAVAKGFDVPDEEARQYMMYGCGEYVLDHQSIGSPDGALNVAKALDVTLRNGVDGFTRRRMGLALGDFRGFRTFEELRTAFLKQVQNQIELLAEVQAAIYRDTGRDAAFPFLSLLYDDCLARGKPLLAGGVKYCGGTLESFGNNTAADSLLAIKIAVYDKKLMTCEELLACLDADFKGFERQRRMLQALPKYGNDDGPADEMAVQLNREICRFCRDQAGRFGLDNFMIVLVNNGDSVLFGKTTAATADGRKAGEPLSNGNQPSAGSDHKGLTALLNSMAKLDPSVHAGATHNIKLSREMFRTRRPEIIALLKGYFARGGTQAMITVTDRGELEKAMAHPENYANLIVRVGGYSERFIDLPKDIQAEIIQRTLY